jgi:group I intron endonuclease
VRVRGDTPGVYRIVNRLNGATYIGSTKYLSLRWKQHLRKLRTNSHFNAKLQRSWNKYGESNFYFEIIEFVFVDSQLLVREQFFIDSMRPALNILAKAGTTLGFKHSVETRARMKGQQNRKGKPHPPETIAYFRETRKGCKPPRPAGWKHTPETIQKMIAQRQPKEPRSPRERKKRDKKKSGENIPKGREPGFKCSQETRDKMSRAAMGKQKRLGMKSSEETKERIRQGVIRNWEKRRQLKKDNE